MTSTNRLFDFAMASFLLALFAPLLFVLIIMMLALQGRPIFYVSERMKTPSICFRFYKFRTMHPVENALNSGVSGGDKCNRITWLGRFMRPTHLDELPQLWNVLRGDMSFIGPRPPLRQYVECFPALYANVLQSQTGMTGLATLTFHSHEARILRRCKTAQETDEIYRRRCIERKARLDLIYQANRSFCTDICLLLRTAKTILRL